MDIQFNTNRPYTILGQFIRAVWDEDREVIHFADTSRAVHGTIIVPTHLIHFTRPGPLARYVMEHYDRMNYQRTMESADLLLMKGLTKELPIHEFQL